jgi:pyruvate dehydrogenase E2 component (dihydrolipoamide acetyltransferase)
MDQHDATINGPLLRLRRETRGWGQSDVATRACMSIKQIRQLEDGGLSAFYSEAIKITAAKKVGALLGMTEAEVFSLGQAPEAVADAHEEASAEHAPSYEQVPVAPSPEPVVAAHPDPVETPAHEEVSKPEPVVHAQSDAPAAASAQGKSKTSWGLLFVLFVGALVVAAYFRPTGEPASSEPPPPLQPALQVEPADPAASAASAAQEGSAPPASQPAASPAPAAPSTSSEATKPEATKPAAPAAPATAPAQAAPAPAAKPAATPSTTATPAAAPATPAAAPVSKPN